MNKQFFLETLPRWALGVLFLIGAADGFSYIFTNTHLLNMPTSEAGREFEAALKDTQFMWPLMKSIELIGAGCLLANRAPALGLALLAPIMTVSVLFHVVLNPQGIPFAIILVVLGALVLRANFDRYVAMLE